MTFPPPQPPSPPGYQSVPSQPQPPAMGPGGAYGPVGMPAGQPVPGQMPVMTMNKPGTVTGIQVILWIFLAIGAVGDVFSIINMINYANPIMLIALAYALYTTIQSALTPVHIARGKRWAWIWNLVSVIFGLTFAAVGIVFGILFIDLSPLPLLIGLVFAALNGTLLGLLCSRSARQWIMMHRIQRGEVQVTGMPGMPGMGNAAGAPQPERPATRPGSATFAVILHGALMALSAWAVYGIVSALVGYYGVADDGLSPLYATSVMMGSLVPLAFHSLLLLCVLISGILVLRGRVGGRIFGLVWIAVLLVPFGFLVFTNLVWLSDVRHYGLPPVITAARTALILSGLQFALLVCLYIMLFMPGVRRWTPGRPATAIVMMVPGGQPGMQAPQGYAPPGPAPQQQATYPPPQPPYPPQY